MTGSRTFRAVISVLLCLFTAGTPAQPPEPRAAWREAYDAIRHSGAELPRTRALRRYALYPYLESAALIARLKEPERYSGTISAASALLEQYRDTAIADAFRRELLYTLSGLGKWPDFVAFYAQDVANISRECEYLRARVALDLTDGLAPLIEQRWLTPRRLDAACEPAFQWLRSAGVLDAELTSQRIELLLGEGDTEFARVIAARLNAQQAEVFRQWAGMLDAPLDALDDFVDGMLTPLHAQALSTVWTRASTRAPLATLERLPRVLAMIAEDADDAQQMRRELALGLSWDRRSEALDVFAQLDDSAHDDYSRGWLARSALWNGEFELTDRTIAAMSLDARDQSVWLYWRARAAEQLGRPEEARRRYSELLDRDNFYSALAAARLSSEILPNNLPAQADPQLIDNLAQRAGFIRARELLFTGERTAATREWQYATRNLNTAELTAALHLATDWSWHDMAVATATRADVFFDYGRLYPRPWATEIASAATAADLEPALLSALIRQESMFRPDAVSSAGALGLAQVGLATARTTARSLGLPLPDRADLFDPARNTQLGAATLRSGLQRFAQQLPVALAAYNAGPGAAQRWLPEQAIESDIWIENIPYNETREYVRRVLWNEVVYTWLLTNQQPVNTGILLGRISAPAASAE